MCSRHGWLRYAGLILVISGLLAGCAEDDETRDSERESTQQQSGSSGAVPDDSEPEFPVLTDPVEITAEVEQRSDQRLRVTGRTNLPDGTELSIVVERQASGVRWRHIASVENERFAAEPFGPGSGLPEGEYVLTVSVRPAGVQPDAVREIIGGRGEHLSGDLVSESRHQGATATYVTRYAVSR